MQADEKWKVCVNRQTYLEVHPDTPVAILYQRGIVSPTAKLLCSYYDPPTLESVGHYTFRQLYSNYYGGTVHFDFAKE